MDPTPFRAKFRDANPLRWLIDPKTVPKLEPESFWKDSIPSWTHTLTELPGLSVRGWSASEQQEFTPSVPMELGSMAVVLRGPSLPGYVGSVIRLPQWLEAIRMRGCQPPATTLPDPKSKKLPTAAEWNRARMTMHRLNRSRGDSNFKQALNLVRQFQAQQVREFLNYRLPDQGAQK